MIFMSAGHSAVKGKNYDPGAVGKTTVTIQVTEAELTQDFENLVLVELTKKGFKYITDEPDESLGDYLKRIQTGSGSVVLESHFDAAESPSATGTTAIVGNDADSLDKAFAKELVDATSSILGIRNRGAITEAQSARGSLGLMRKQGIVALLEICFISNPNDIAAYQKNKYKLAAAVADILIKYENMKK